MCQTAGGEVASGLLVRRKGNGMELIRLDLLQELRQQYSLEGDSTIDKNI